MAFYHGVKVFQNATALSTPVVADSGIPFVVGTAPVHTAEKPAKPNAPVLCTSWDEAVQKLGYSDDWENYTLCEFMYSHFKLYNCQPVIFCNVLDMGDLKEYVPAQEMTLANHRFTLPESAIMDSLSVMDSGTANALEGANDAVGAIGHKDGLTGCGVIFNEQKRTFVFTLTGAASEVHNTGAFEAISSLIAAGYTVSIEGRTIEGLSDFQETAAWGQISEIQEAETVSFVVRAAKAGTVIEYGVTVGYPAPGGTVKAASIALAPVGYVAGTDYEAIYGDGKLIIEVLEDGAMYSAEKVNVAYSKAAPGDVGLADIADGLEAIELCMPLLGMVPDLICVPGYSGNSEIAALMSAKAGGINGLFLAKALIDIEGAEEYTDTISLKNNNSFVDVNEIVCWPMLTLGDKKFHMSTQLAGLMAQVDTNNGGVPYESPSNKNFQCDGCVLADGTEVALTLTQANVLNANGICTALNFMNGWTAWGNYTGCYPANTDAKDYFIPVSRMFGWVGTTILRTYWRHVDKPMIRRAIENIVDSANIWFNGLVGAGYLMGARIEFINSENPDTDLMAGILKFHIYMTPPSPMQEIHFALEYDASYLSALAG